MRMYPDNHHQQNAILWETLAYHRTAGLSFKGPDEQNQKALKAFKTFLDEFVVRKCGSGSSWKPLLNSRLFLVERINRLTSLEIPRRVHVKVQYGRRTGMNTNSGKRRKKKKSRRETFGERFGVSDIKCQPLFNPRCHSAWHSQPHSWSPTLSFN